MSEEELTEKVAVLVAALGLTEKETQQLMKSIARDGGANFMRVYRRTSSAIKASSVPDRTSAEMRSLRVRKRPTMPDEQDVLEAVRQMLVRELGMTSMTAARFLAKELKYSPTVRATLTEIVLKLIQAFDESAVLAAAHRVRNNRVHSLGHDVDWPLKEDEDKK